MIEECVERSLQITGCIGAGRHGNVYAEKVLLRGWVMVGIGLHGEEIFTVAGADIHAATGPCGVGDVAGDIPAEAGEDFGEAHDIVIGIRRNGLAGAVELLSTVVVELIEADGGQLHDFSRVVFIGVSGGVSLVIAEHGEVFAHHGVESEIFKELSEIAKGVRAKSVVVIGFTARHVLDGGIDAGVDEDFRESVLHALAKLVAGGKVVLPEGVLDVDLCLIVLHVQCGVAFDVTNGAGRIVEEDCLLDARFHFGWLHVELFVEPGLITDEREMVDFLVGWAEGGLYEKAGCVFRADGWDGSGSLHLCNEVR